MISKPIIVVSLVARRPNGTSHPRRERHPFRVEVEIIRGSSTVGGGEIHLSGMDVVKIVAHTSPFRLFAFDGGKKDALKG